MNLLGLNFTQETFLLGRINYIIIDSVIYKFSYMACLNFRYVDKSSKCSEKSKLSFLTQRFLLDISELGVHSRPHSTVHALCSRTQVTQIRNLIIRTDISCLD